MLIIPRICRIYINTLADRISSCHFLQTVNIIILSDNYRLPEERLMKNYYYDKIHRKIGSNVHLARKSDIGSFSLIQRRCYVIQIIFISEMHQIQLCWRSMHWSDIRPQQQKNRPEPQRLPYPLLSALRKEWH